MATKWTEIDLSDDAVFRLAEVISDHLPAQDPEYSDSDEAEFIAASLLSPTGRYDVWDHAKEAAKLDDLRRAALDLRAIYEELHPSIQSVLSLVSIGMKVRGYQTADPLPGLDVISALPEMTERAIRAAEVRLSKGGAAGRLDWLAVSTVVASRIVWFRRLGTEPPRTVNDTAPFANFLRDVFAALEIKANPRAAVDAWRRVQSHDKKT